MAAADRGASTVLGYLTTLLQSSVTPHEASGKTQVGELYKHCGIYRSELKVPNRSCFETFYT
jgi:hypothetical protein